MTASKPIFVEESFEILARMVPAETDDDALSSELFGLGHLYKPEAVPILVQYSGHRNEDVRFAVACSLGHFSQDPSSVEHLVGLADDPDSDVRNWTLFALGSQSDVDSAELRDIFARHLNDSDPDSREEALAGLAKRKDSRAALPLLQLMLAGSYYSHHDYDFKALVDEPDDADWGTEDFIDALYERFPDLLPPRGNS